jgi:hypothetical protein
VASADSGINKPFDRILKSFADDEPALFLRLLGFVPEGVEAEIQPLRPETAPAVVLPDFVAMFRTSQAGPTIAHAEFESRYDLSVPGNIARYGGSLSWQHQIPVESALVLMRQQGVPSQLPEVGHYDIGKTHTAHPYRVVRLWEIDPKPVLDTNNPRLLPWALLLDSTDEQVRAIARIVASRGDDEAVSRFLQLGSIRYDRNTLIDMLGGVDMGIMRAFLDGSSIVREERAEGRTEGQAGEARKILCFLLQRKFPDLDCLPAIEQISSVDQLEKLIETAYDATNADALRTAILTAADKLN